jgi:transcriptional regulator with XRE-family HTH domain
MPETPGRENLFGERLREARRTRGLEQQKLAELVGLPPSSISHFESGSRKPSFDNLRALAQKLDVTTDYLLGRVEHMDRVEGAQRLHRHLGALSDKDVQTVEGFIKMLKSQSSETKK